MADISVTAASVVPGSDAIYVDGTAGETITAGMTCYKSTSDSKWYKADNNDTAAKAVVGGISLNGASLNQPIRIQTGGTITIGATVAVGTIYVQSTTAGGIAPSADLATGNYVTILGVATTAAIIKLGLNVSGIAKA